MPVTNYAFHVDTSDLDRARRSLGQLGGSLTGLASGSLAPLLALTGGLGLGAAAVMGFQRAMHEAGDMESIVTNFRVLLGSASGARELAASLNQISATSHLGMDGLGKAAQTMLGFGVAADQVVPAIKQLGDVSLGNADRFAALSLAFSQTAAAGRLMGQDLLQYINAGFNPLQEISQKTGKSMMDLRKEVEAGNISFAQVADALRTATSEGGRFFGATEEGAKTFNGRMATMANRVTTLFREFGKPVNDALGPLLDSASQFISSLKDSAADWGAQMASAIGTVRGLFENGDLGEALMLTLKIGFAEAVNYGAGLLKAMVESIGILLGADIKAGLDLFRAMTTPDFWKGMGNAWHALALEFASLLETLLAGIFDSISHVKGLGFLKGAADGLRAEAKGDQAQAGALAHRAADQLDPVWEQFKVRMTEVSEDVKEAFNRNLSNTPKLIDDFEESMRLLELIGQNAKPGEAKPDAPDRAKDEPVTAAAAAEVNRGRGKVDTLSDRLSKIGLFIGGNGGPRGQKAQEDTARNTRLMHEELVKMNADRVAYQQAFANF